MFCTLWYDCLGRPGIHHWRGGGLHQGAAASAAVAGGQEAAQGLHRAGAQPTATGVLQPSPSAQPPAAPAATQVHAANKPAARRADQPQDAAAGSQQPVQTPQAADIGAPTATGLVGLRVPGDDANTGASGSILPAVAGHRRCRPLRLRRHQQAAAAGAASSGRWCRRPPGREGGVLRRQPGGEDGVAPRAWADREGHRRAGGAVTGDPRRQDQHSQRHCGELLHHQGALFFAFHI